MNLIYYFLSTPFSFHLITNIPFLLRITLSTSTYNVKIHTQSRRDTNDTTIIMVVMMIIIIFNSPCHFHHQLMTTPSGHTCLFNLHITSIYTDACKESSWETHTDMVSCVEDVTFYCRGMFPKPAPVCGIYNDVTGKQSFLCLFLLLHFLSVHREFPVNLLVTFL